jgi:hypothetical protein
MLASASRKGKRMLGHFGGAAKSAFYARLRRVMAANPESIAITGCMDSGPARFARIPE